MRLCDYESQETISDINIGLPGTKRRREYSIDTFGYCAKKSRNSVKSRDEMGYMVDDMLMKTLHDLAKLNVGNDKSDECNADTMFCKRLISTLKVLPKRQNSEAKLKIQQFSTLMRISN